MHDRLWTGVTAVTVALLLIAAGGWFIRVDQQHDAQLQASCERSNVLRAYAAADNLIALQLDEVIAAAPTTDRQVELAARRSAMQRRLLAQSLSTIDCQEAIR
jgi:hypothetical protein